MLSDGPCENRAVNSCEPAPPIVGSAESVPPLLSAGPPPLVAGPRLASGPWDFWATVGFTVAIGAAGIGAQAIILVVALAAGAIFHFKVSLDGLESNGLLLGLATCASAPLVMGLAWFFATLRKTMSARDYLALRMVPARTVVRWAVVMLVFLAVSDGFTYLLGKPIVPEFMERAYATAGFVPLLWLTVLVAAPVSEETVFRGFFFAGVSRSRLGAVGAIVLGSLIWSGLHLQYDAYGMMSIFLGGLLLGWARWKTNSTLLAIILHALMNLLATLEVVVKLHYRGGG